MKRIFFIILIFCILTPISKRSYAEEYDPQHTLLALNYAIMSIYRVEKYPSRVTVDEEYNGIINNLAIGNISDDIELKNLFKAMMDAYTEDKLTEKDRQLIQRQYEAQVNTAFLKVKPLSHIQTEVAFSTAKEVVAAVRDSEGFWSGFFAAGGATANGLMEYNLALQANERMRMQAQSEENEFMQQRMTSEWALDKEKIRRFNNLKTSLLDAEWTLLRKYNIPDEARLTEDSIDEFYSFISEKDTEKALRSAKRLIGSFSFYPPYWFYYGKTALEYGDVELAKSCFNKFFEQSRPILRKDQFIASTSRYKIFTLKNNEQDQAKELLVKIEKNSNKDDWNNYLFCALQWYVLGDKNKADELLLRNIDFNFNVDLHKELRRQLKNNKIDTNNIKYVVIQNFTNLTELEKLANDGNAEAQYQLSVKISWDYRNTGSKNIDKSLTWLKKAAEQKHDMASCCLKIFSWIKDNNSISKQEIEQVYQVLTNNLETNKDAPYYLALFYKYGINRNKDKQKFIDLMRKSSEMGCGGAKIILAELYIEQNPDLSKKLLEEACSIDNSYAFELLGEYYYFGRFGNKNVKKGLELINQSAKHGSVYAMSVLGLLYYTDDSIKDINNAIYWFKIAAEAGDVNAQLSLGRCYEQGNHLEKDEKLAVYWFQKSANQGDMYAMRSLGLCYYNGRGVDMDKGKAFDLLNKSANKGDSFSQCLIGNMYYDGDGVAKDYNKSFYWIQKSAEQDFDEAQAILGIYYYEGIGTIKDKSKAMYWLEKASNKGNKVAINFLKKIK